MFGVVLNDNLQRVRRHVLNGRVGVADNFSQPRVDGQFHHPGTRGIAARHRRRPCRRRIPQRRGRWGVERLAEQERGHGA